MIVYIYLKDEYISGWGSTKSSYKDIKIEIDEDHEMLINPEIFKYVGGKLIKDEERQQQLLEEQEKENSKLSIEDQNSIAILELAESLATLGITGLSTQLGGK